MKPLLARRSPRAVGAAAVASTVKVPRPRSPPPDPTDPDRWRRVGSRWGWGVTDVEVRSDLVASEANRTLNPLKSKR